MKLFSSLTVKYHVQPSLLPRTADAWMECIKPHLYSEPHPTVPYKLAIYPLREERPVLVVDDAMLCVVVQYEKRIPKDKLEAAYLERKQQMEERLERELDLDEELLLGEEVEQALLPEEKPTRIFTKVLVDLISGLILVDTSKEKQADLCLKVLRHVLDTLPVKPPYADDMSPDRRLAECATLEEKLNDEGEVTGMQWRAELPRHISHGDVLVLQSRAEKSQRNRSVNIPFDDESIQLLLADDFDAKEIGLCFARKLWFVLTDNLVFKRLQWDLQEEMNYLFDTYSEQERHDEEFTRVMVKVLRYVVPAMMRYCQCIDSGIWLTGFEEQEQVVLVDLEAMYD